MSKEIIPHEKILQIRRIYLDLWKKISAKSLGLYLRLIWVNMSRLTLLVLMHFIEKTYSFASTIDAISTKSSVLQNSWHSKLVLELVLWKPGLDPFSSYFSNIFLIPWDTISQLSRFIKQLILNLWVWIFFSLLFLLLWTKLVSIDAC